MTFDSRIRSHLEAQLDSVPAANGDLDQVLARGHRRRISYRVTQAVAVAAAVVLAVASTALIVSLLSNGPRLVVSPITGEELPVISEDPLVLQAQPGPAPDDVPEGTEVPIRTIDSLVGAEEGDATTLRPLGSPGGPIVAIGNVQGWRIFTYQTSRRKILITDASGQFVLGNATGGENTGMTIGVAQGYFAVALVGPDVETVTLTIDGESAWQQPVEGVAVFPLNSNDTQKHLTLTASTGTLLLETGPDIAGPEDEPLAPTQPADTGNTALGQGWHAIADAPIVGRYANASAWTGEYVLLWGGIHRPSDLDPDLSDGARYDPATDEWAMLPPAPDGMSGPARSVWTGDRWIVRTDHVPDGPVQLASYDPVANEWTELDTGPLGYGDGYLMMWTGDEVIFWGGHGGDVLSSGAPAAYNPATATWRELAAAPIATRTDPVAAWNGSELLVWGGTVSCSGGDSTCVEFATDGAALNPADISWRALPVNPNVAPDTSTAGSVLIGGEFVVFLPIDCESGRCVAGIAYDPATDTWRRLPDLGNMEWSFSAGPVAAESEIYAWDRTGEGFTYSPAVDRWTDLGEYPMENRFSATVVAIGDQVLVWGGWTGAAADDPFNDGFLTVP